MTMIRRRTNNYPATLRSLSPKLKTKYLHADTGSESLLLLFILLLLLCRGLRPLSFAIALLPSHSLTIALSLSLSFAIALLPSLSIVFSIAISLSLSLSIAISLPLSLALLLSLSLCYFSIISSSSSIYFSFYLCVYHFPAIHLYGHVSHCDACLPSALSRCSSSLLLSSLPLCLSLLLILSVFC